MAPIVASGPLRKVTARCVWCGHDMIQQLQVFSTSKVVRTRKTLFLQLRPRTLGQAFMPRLLPSSQNRSHRSVNNSGRPGQRVFIKGRVTEEDVFQQLSTSRCDASNSTSLTHPAIAMTHLKVASATVHKQDVARMTGLLAVSSWKRLPTCLREASAHQHV